MPKGLINATLLLLAAQQTTLPPNYNTILENQTFRIIQVHYGPHEKVPIHDHPDTPTVYVYLNNSGPVRITHEEKDGSQSSLVRPPNTPEPSASARACSSATPSKTSATCPPTSSA